LAFCRARHSAAKQGFIIFASTSQKILVVLPALVNKAFYGGQLGFLAFAVLA
jgi:hypothetical protein